MQNRRSGFYQCFLSEGSPAMEAYRLAASEAIRQLSLRLPDPEQLLIAELLERPSADSALECLFEKDDVASDERIEALRKRRLDGHQTTRHATIAPDSDSLPQLLAIAVNSQREAAWLIARVLERRFAEW